MTARVLHGDSREVLPTLDAESIDAVVTDPPYALTSILKRFGSSTAAPLNNADERNGRNGPYHRASAGFMGQRWDTGEVAFDPAFWAEVLRVLKPGGHVVACGGTRTCHRLVTAIEDAGFEIRDQLAWVYGSGFPKSHNVGGGWGTALKPAFEPICLARKPLVGTVAQNVARYGTGAINVDGCRVGNGEVRQSSTGGMGRKTNPIYGAFARPDCAPIDTTLGRFPANLLHDGSDEVKAAFAAFGEKASGIKNGGQYSRVSGVHEGGQRLDGTACFGDTGSAARFFYQAKADSDDRAGSKHPTVKPVDLMRWLCRLVTPPGGVVLDPFAGTGTTGEAALRERFTAVLIEREPAYCDDIARRLELLRAGPVERAEILGRLRAVDWTGTLFEGLGS